MKLHLTLLLIGFVVTEWLSECGEAFDRFWERTFTKAR